MDKRLNEKINSLPLRDKGKFYSRLYDTLSDRNSCLMYGIGDEDYANPSLAQINNLGEKLYDEMFNSFVPSISLINLAQDVLDVNKRLS